MNDIELKLNEFGRGAFVIQSNEELLAVMEIEIRQNTIIVLHTEVTDMLKDQGIGKKLVEAMADYARKNNLKVYPLCTYTHAQFKRSPEKYDDLWQRDGKIIDSFQE